MFDDRGGNRITLRPELTPSLARVIAKRQNQLVFPLRWWSFGPFWRYERPQKGRSREFFQWNIDMIGDASPEADAELIAIAAKFLKAIRLTPDVVKIFVNNRSLMERETNAIGITDELRPKVYRLIDRIGKMDSTAWKKYAHELGLNSSQITNLEKLIQDKDLWKNSKALKRIFQVLDTYEISEYVEFSPKIIRGLDYYTGTVFEAWDTAGDFRSLFGGGRYDNLVDDVGGQPIPAVGFAVGNMVISLLLEKLDRLPKTTKSPAQVLITMFDDEHILPALDLSNHVRQNGLNVTTYQHPAKLSKQFKYADRIGVQIVLVLGPDEVSSNSVTIKNLSSGYQQSVQRSTVVENIRKQLEGRSPS